MAKSCKSCGLGDPAVTFHERHGVCRPCQAAKARAWRAANPELARAQRRASERARYARDPKSFKEKQRRYWSRNFERIREARRIACARQRRRLREQVIEAYGGRCECCGEARQEFLAVDHIAGDGAAHRRQLPGGNSFYRWLRRNGFPKDRFRLLCHNCNFARGHYGYCPHETERASAFLIAALSFGA